MKKIINLVLSIIAVLLHGTYIHQALWKQGSSAAFDINLLLWAVTLLWLGFSILLIYTTAKGFFTKNCKPNTP
jgi:hypothetical protein